VNNLNSRSALSRFAVGSVCSILMIIGARALAFIQSAPGIGETRASLVTVVRRDARGKYGGQTAGIIVGEGGDVVTSSVEGESQSAFEVRTSEARTYAARRSPISDAASGLIVFSTKIGRAKLQPTRVAGTLPQRGDSLFVVNSDDAACNNIVTGKVASVESLSQTDMVFVEAIGTAVGGLVFNAEGDWVGTVRSVEPNRATIIAGRTILSLLNRAGVRYTVSNRGRSAAIPPGPDGVRVLGEELAGEAVKRVEPVYPRKALAARVAGTVNVALLVDERGSVTRAWAVDGNPLLQEAAIGAAYAWKFAPATFKGTPVRLRGVISFRFRL